jgi:L-lactate dehydrogenase complex protein LldE
VKVALFITCLTDAYFPRAGIAVVKVLEHLGHTVEFPAAQTCCGQPMFNNGFTSDARDLARHMIDVFEPYSTVVTPSGSCAAMIREHYPHLFAGDPTTAARAVALAARTYEFSEFLTKVLHVDLRTRGVRWEGDVTSHSACHLRTLGLTGVADDLLRQIPGVHLTPLPNAEPCCGFGGTFAVKYPQISGGMVGEKVASIKATGCRTVVCSEAGCGMNLAGACRRAGSDVRFISLPEIIAEGLGLLPRQEAAP